MYQFAQRRNEREEVVRLIGDTQDRSLKCPSVGESSAAFTDERSALVTE
jgi:hypothetical protein